MSKLLQRNRKAQILTKLHLSLQKYKSFNSQQSLSESQLLKNNQNNDELTKQLKKLLQSNTNKKKQLKQQLITGPIAIDLNEQMQDLKWRMNILRQNHRSSKNSNNYNSLSLTAKNNDSDILQKKQQLTFNQLYNIQKQKFAALRQRRKTKRSNIQYLDMIGNKQSRKERKKQMNEQKFTQQMRLLDQAIQS